MVVMFIVGIAAAAVVLTLPDGRPALADEAQAFAARLTRAQEEAVLANRIVDVAVTAEGYDFRTQARGAWTPLGKPFGRQAWSEGTAAIFEAADGRESLRFESAGVAAPGVVTLSRAGRRVKVAVDAAGNVRIDATAG